MNRNMGLVVVQTGAVRQRVMHAPGNTMRAPALIPRNPPLFSLAVLGRSLRIHKDVEWYAAGHRAVNNVSRAARGKLLVIINLCAHDTHTLHNIHTRRDQRVHEHAREPVGWRTRSNTATP